MTVFKHCESYYTLEVLRNEVAIRTRRIVTRALKRDQVFTSGSSGVLLEAIMHCSFVCVSFRKLNTLLLNSCLV